MGRPTKLTPEVQKGIVSAIHAGAYEWVAAAAHGIGVSTYHRWMARGAEEDEGIYREFREEVERARAMARLAVEVEVRKADPKFWLRCGPGKERPGEPGWTDRVEVTGAGGGPVLLAGALVELAGDERETREALAVDVTPKLPGSNGKNGSHAQPGGNGTTEPGEDFDG